MTAACAQIVERDDPRLYATALFAPQPGRARLMVLYAFDCELSRATRASHESLIPRMRLQWWRDVIGAATEGQPAKAHEVAGPLCELIQGSGDERLTSSLAALVDAHEMELDVPWMAEKFATWRGSRFSSLIGAAAFLLTGADVEGPATPWFADAFALRHAARRAGEGRPVFIPGISGSDLAALGRGELTETARHRCHEVAEQGLTDLKRARLVKADKRLLPLLLPTIWAERTLKTVIQDPVTLVDRAADPDRPFDGLRLLYRSVSGRW